MFYQWYSRFLATGCFLMTESDIIKCHPATVCRKLPAVLKIIAEIGNQGMIRMPNNVLEMAEAKKKFYEICGFPGVIGTIGNSFKYTPFYFFQ